MHLLNMNGIQTPVPLSSIDKFENQNPEISVNILLLITLYQEAECLWNSRNADYKSQSKKKQPKIEIGKHFGLSGVYSFFW